MALSDLPIGTTMKRIVLGATLGFAFIALPGLAQTPQTRTFPLPNQTFIHDVAPAPGGLIWWTAQHDGKLGILDPVTGANSFVDLGPNSRPHGVIQSRDGKAWVTDGGQNAIVSYDPQTGKVTAYKLPDVTGGDTNLNTPTEDGDGNIWFTGQEGWHGRVDVKTGKVDAWKSPKGRGPYGIATTPDGNVWFVSLAGSYLGQVDRKTGEVKVIEPPVPNTGLRRVWSDSRGDLWMSEWTGGQISHYSPATGKWQRIPIPGVQGASLYAVYVDKQDVVWVSNWADNTTYAYDPNTGKFTAIPGSRPGAAIRQILGTNEAIYLPESGNAAITVVTTGP
jgi:virginiamycin B lyase